MTAAALIHPAEEFSVFVRKDTASNPLGGKLDQRPGFSIRQHALAKCFRRETGAFR